MIGYTTIGTNDLEEKGEPEVIVRNVKTLLGTFKTHNPNMPVIVCKVMPSHASKSRPADKIQKINALVEELVKGNSQVVLCDSYSIFADEQGNAKKEEFPDLLHPNGAGVFASDAGLQRAGLSRPQEPHPTPSIQTCCSPGTSGARSAADTITFARNDASRPSRLR